MVSQAHDTMPMASCSGSLCGRELRSLEAEEEDSDEILLNAKSNAFGMMMQMARQVRYSEATTQENLSPGTLHSSLKIDQSDDTTRRSKRVRKPAVVLAEQSSNTASRKRQRMEMAQKPKGRFISASDGHFSDVRASRM